MLLMEKSFSDKVKLFNKVEEIGNKYGIGRDMHIGDTIIGIKGREDSKLLLLY